VNPKTRVEFRGGKGNLYEGGLKIPFLVQWAGKVKAGSVSDFVFYQPDIMATLAEVSGTKAPEDTDGLSILPTILGNTEDQKKHKMLYWEYGNQVAARFGKWKAIKAKKDAEWALYDLGKDISETADVSKENTEILAKMKEFVKASHTPAQPGKFLDPQRIRHERDRKAKWGSSKPPAPKKKKKKKALK